MSRLELVWATVVDCKMCWSTMELQIREAQHTYRLYLFSRAVKFDRSGHWRERCIYSIGGQEMTHIHKLSCIVTSTRHQEVCNIVSNQQSTVFWRCMLKVQHTYVNCTHCTVVIYKGSGFSCPRIIWNNYTCTKNENLVSTEFLEWQIQIKSAGLLWSWPGYLPGIL